MTWYGGATDTSSYDVFVSRMDGGSWVPEIELTADMPGDHWFCDIAADSSGTAHVVWGESTEQVIYYSRSEDGLNWTTPFVINPRLLGVIAATWPAPSIQIDRQGYVHVAWLGRKLNPDGTASDWDVYYSMYDGSHWTSPKMIHVDNDDTDWYPEIAVNSTDDIWVTWGRDGSFGISRVMVAHFDGETWSEETRLDNDEWEFDGGVDIALDPDGNPWVVWWSVTDPGSGTSEIYYSRYDPGPVPVLLSSLDYRSLPGGVELSWRASPGVFSKFLVERAENQVFMPAGEVLARGQEPYLWRDIGLSDGIYRYLVIGDLLEGQTLTEGPIEVVVGDVILALRPNHPNPFRAQTKLVFQTTTDGPLVLSIYDLTGRQVARPVDANLPAGKHEIRWDGLDRSGRELPAGVYLMRLETPDGAKSRKIVKIE